MKSFSTVYNRSKKNVLNNRHDLYENQKKQKLESILKGYGRVAVAFSGGVDSTFLLKTAHNVLGDQAVAVTVRSVFVPEKEQEEAERFCSELGIRLISIDADVLQIEGLADNPPNRCYICKKELFTRIREQAGQLQIRHIAEGSNTDDLSDYRPGMAAIRELGIHSPLCEAGLGKSEIRNLSQDLLLPTWNKPSMACLASRFVYGETITKDQLKMVERAEELLHLLGFRQYRVRIHGGSLARIEVEPEEIHQLLPLRGQIHTAFRQLGFSFVTVDLGGYRTGSMNEAIGIQ